MKYFLTVILLFSLFALCAFAATSMDARQMAMGGIKVAYSGPDINYFDNPASVYFYKQQHTVEIGALVSDSSLKDFPAGLNLAGSARFISKNLSIGVMAALAGTNIRDKDEYTLVDIEKGFEIDADIAFGYKDFGAGLTVTGGSFWYRYDSKLYPQSKFIDFFREAFMGKYKRENSSQYLELGAGFIANMWNVRFGVLCDNIFSHDGNTMDFTVKPRNMLDNLGVGFYYQMNPFSERGRFRRTVCSAGLEIQKIGLETRTINGGAEIKFQLSRKTSIGLRGGCELPLSALKNGVTTLGGGVRFGKIDISCVAKLPFGVYKGKSDDIQASIVFNTVI